MNSLYQGFQLKKSLQNYFSVYKNSGLTKPAFEHYFHLVLAILVSASVQSIRYLFTWFLRHWSEKKLNSYYAFLKTCHKHLAALDQTNLKLALSVHAKALTDWPILLLLDDTLQAKFGTQFENWQCLYDHACHQGNQYLKGHCFVCLMVKVPIQIGQNVRYLAVPIACRQWSPEKSKLQIGAELIEQAMAVMPEDRTVLLLCDSWYTKKEILETGQKTERLELIGGVRKNTVLYELPDNPPGKRGRPRLRGDRFPLTAIETPSVEGDYCFGIKKCMTNLFKQPVLILRSCSKTGEDRVFLSTIAPNALVADPEISKETEDVAVRCYQWYRHRWSIETYFFKQKTFWGFGDYRLRTKAGMEMYLHLLSSAYTCVILLPLLNPDFANLASESLYSRKMLISQRFMQEFFFVSFVRNAQNHLNKHKFVQLLNLLGLVIRDLADFL